MYCCIYCTSVVYTVNWHLFVLLLLHIHTYILLLYVQPPSLAKNRSHLLPNPNPLPKKKNLTPNQKEGKQGNLTPLTQQSGQGQGARKGSKCKKKRYFDQSVSWGSGWRETQHEYYLQYDQDDCAGNVSIAVSPLYSLYLRENNAEEVQCGGGGRWFMKKTMMCLHIWLHCSAQRRRAACTKSVTLTPA